MRKMMKILLLNPHIGAEHGVMGALLQRGVVLLHTSDLAEAWQVLQFHGSSVDLAIIHREGLDNKETEPGLKFINQIKADASQSDLPIILTSEVWSDPEFAKHQDTPQGVNAYLRYPYSEEQLTGLIEAVLGVSLQAQLQANSPKLNFESPTVFAQEKTNQSNELVLEDAAVIYQNEEKPEPQDIDIQLDAPESQVISTPESSSALEVFSVPELPTASEATAILETPEPSLQLESNKADIPTAHSSHQVKAEPITAATAAYDELTSTYSPSEKSKVSILNLNEEHVDSIKETISQVEDNESDKLIAQEMPYLLEGAAAEKGGFSIQEELIGSESAFELARPIGDAVVPGGAAHTPDIETLKKYLLLREQDVAALSSQMKSAREQVAAVEDVLRLERVKNIELTHTIQEQKRKIDDFERDKSIALEALQSESNELRFQLKTKADKVRVLELHVREATEEMERLKERVRSDIRKIRVREKELENRLEIMKKDSEALIGARENKIVELKRKLDLLEFNMDLLQDKHSREKENAVKLRECLSKAAQAVRVAGGLLNSREPGPVQREERISAEGVEFLQETSESPAQTADLAGKPEEDVAKIVFITNESEGQAAS